MDEASGLIASIVSLECFFALICGKVTTLDFFVVEEATVASSLSKKSSSSFSSSSFALLYAAKELEFF